MSEGKVEEMAYWINERYAMKQRKEKFDLKEYGYSDDPIMGFTRWCNVHREDDAVTRWIAKNWRDKNAGHPNLTLAMVIARMINWPDTLEVIGFPYKWDAEEVAHKIYRLRAKKVKVWTSAYTISTCGRSIAKEQYVIYHVCDTVAQRPNWPWEQAGGQDLLGPCSLAHAQRALMNIDGLGSFLAAQVVADLKNTPGHPLQSASDWSDWAAPGPGSLRGIEAFYGRPVAPSQFLAQARACKLEVTPFINPEVPPIHMQDFQNCLCEFSKYMKLKEGRGHARNKYRPVAR